MITLFDVPSSEPAKKAMTAAGQGLGLTLGGSTLKHVCNPVVRATMGMNCE